MLNFKERIKEICRESKHLLPAKNYEAVEWKIVDHYSKRPVIAITDTVRLKISNLLDKISKNFAQ